MIRAGPMRAHHLASKLKALEREMIEPMSNADVERLCAVLRQLEEIVECEDCHRAYLSAGFDYQLETQINRIQEKASHGFSLIENRLSSTLRDQASVSRYFVEVSRSALREAITLGLDHHSRVLFVGCGAVPMSCHILCNHFGCQVVGLDTDPECVDSARRYAEKTAQSARLSFQLGDGAAIACGDFTHVVVASLVRNKDEVLENLSRSSKPGLKVAIRFGEGLHRLINFPQPQVLSASWHKNRVSMGRRGLYQTLYVTRTDL